MISPAVSAQRLLTAVVMGLGLGLIYGFLRPLRRVGNWLRDLIFTGCLLWAWVYLGFGVCGGDLRLGYFAGLLMGVLLWEKTLGKLLQPLIFGFWGFVFRFLSFFPRIMKNFLKKFGFLRKKYLHLGKNRVQ